MNRSSAAIQVRQLGVDYGSRQVLQDVDLDLKQGRWTAIVGPNGAGKSTLLKALAGLLPHRGSVDMPGLPAGAGARAKARHVSWLGQNEGGADDLMVYDLVMLGRLPHQSWLAAPSDTDRAVVCEALQATQAWAWRERSLGELSGGERQRVLLARALAVQADILLMDEPLVNLDPPHQVDWLRLVRGEVSRGRTVVSVLHELSMALLADDIVVMAEGRARYQGPSDERSTHAAIEDVFENRIRVRHIEGQWLCLPCL